MYSVLVLGGIALVGGACGGTITTDRGDAGTGGDGAQEDGGVSDAVPSGDAPEEFPSELPTPIDAGKGDAPGDGFPVLGK